MNFLINFILLLNLFSVFSNCQKITENLKADNKYRYFTTNKYMIDNVTNNIEIGLKITTKQDYVIINLDFDINLSENCEIEMIKLYIFDVKYGLKYSVDCGKGLRNYQSFREAIIQFKGSVTKYNKGFRLSYYSQNKSILTDQSISKKPLVDTKQVIILLFIVIFIPPIIILCLFIKCK